MLDKFSAVKAGINYLAVNTMAEGMLRAYDKCEQNIRERGHKELNGEIWSFTWKEIRFLVVKDKAFFAKAVAMSKKENCIDSVWHIEELLKLIPNDSFICKGNAVKYIWREDHKGSNVQDLEKAVVYLNWAIDHLKDI